SIRAAPSRTPPSISAGRRPASSSRDFSASQSCQPLSMAPATTSSPARTLAAISNSWLIVACLPSSRGSFFPQVLDLFREPLRFTIFGGDAFEDLDPLAQLLDFLLQFLVARRQGRAVGGRLVAQPVLGDPVRCAVPGLHHFRHRDD